MADATVESAASQTQPTPDASLPSQFGLIAGQGDFPLLIAGAARSNGVKVIGFAIKGFASNEIENCCDQVIWLELGQLQRAIDLMHENGIKAVTMAGRVPHTSIFQYRHLDRRAMKLLAKCLTRKADALLGTVVAEFQTEGIEVMDSSLFLKNLMPAAGMLTSARALTAAEQEDVDFGYPLAKAVAGLDIGQTIVVKEKMVVAVEGAEGTDECIKRAGQLAGSHCVVVKVSKPAQDMRFDIPVIGPGTIKSMIEAQATVLTLSARECLVFHRQQLVQDAEAAGIAIIAVGNSASDK